MFDAKTIIWFVITLLLMGFFAGIEMAFYSANRLGIELKKKQGTAAGRLLGQFTESPVRFLGTTLIGFNIFLIFFSLEVSTVMRPHGLILRKRSINKYQVPSILSLKLSSPPLLWSFLQNLYQEPYSGQGATSCLAGWHWWLTFFIRCSIRWLRV